MPLLGCPHCISQPGPVQAPEGREGSRVDLEQTAAAKGASSAEPRPWRYGGQSGVLVENEQVKVLVDAEAGFDETALLVRREGGRNYALETLLRQEPEATSYEVSRGRGPVGHRHQERDGIVRGPRACAGAFFTPADHVA